ncbi:C40 family peptidase [Pseudonocardia abyssalis]|uniref:C40 family peptidase n=1 Tax=Pseudonocardia abyssalis TaxID=2792008 RepID=A0ABS6UPT3_9PSEU|nr:NlpC/P60 family protein [Pseudonocardia abyssalis]MBW0117846.1 C40 family peptidase [Pseudonocardia abyssalis]MBW0134240.1 C40 family peptidase [Pseudonocardia abyssalis]
MRGSVRVVVVLLLVALLGGTSPAFAQPPPPPNPSDDELSSSQQAVQDRAAEVGSLTNRLAELDAQADDLAVELVGQRENAEAAFADLEVAQGAAADAGQRAEAARVATDAATVAIDQARARLDDFVTATYQEGLDTGPLGLLTSSETPEELVARVEFTDLLARAQLAAQDGLERARVDKANADSTARALLEEAQAREAEAARAKESADAAYAAADAAATAQASLLAGVQAERAQVQALLDAAESSDAGLRDQRARYDEWQRVLAEQEAARQRAERQAAAAREEASSSSSVAAPPRAGAGSVQRVIDRAVSQIGVQYVWGGGNGRGATTGIPGPAGDPGNRVGFDCSGLMLYAFNGAGVSLPRVSRNQFNSGRRVPISQLQPGDMVFYKKGRAPIHHVAMYIGDDRMIEAPYTGSEVRIVPLRRKDLVPEAARVL